MEQVKVHPTGCGQCDELAPIVRGLRAKGVANCGINPQLGGGIHAVEVRFTDTAYAYISLEGFSFYDDARDGVDGWDSEGWRNVFMDTLNDDEIVDAFIAAVEEAAADPATAQLVK